MTTKVRVLLPTDHVKLLFTATGEDLSQGTLLEVADDRVEETLDALTRLGLVHGLVTRED